MKKFMLIYVLILKFVLLFNELLFILRQKRKCKQLVVSVRPNDLSKILNQAPVIIHVTSHGRLSKYKKKKQDQMQSMKNHKKVGIQMCRNRALEDC